MWTRGYILPWYLKKDIKNDKFKFVAEKNAGFWVILFFITIFLVKIFGSLLLDTFSSNLLIYSFALAFILFVGLFGPIILFLHLVVKNKRKIYYFLPLCFISAQQILGLIWSVLEKNEAFSEDFLSFLFKDETLSPSSKSDLREFFFSIIVNLFCVIIFIYYSRKYWIITIKNFFNNPKLLVYAIVFFFGLSIFLNWLVPKPISETLEPSNQNSINTLFSNGSYFFYWTFVAAIIITGPIFEEIIYRFLFVQMFGRKKIWLAFIVSSLFFVLAHVHSEDIKNFLLEDWSGKKNILLSFWAYLYPSMLFFGVFYIAKFSLMYPILMHAHSNFLSILLIIII